MVVAFGAGEGLANGEHDTGDGRCRAMLGINGAAPLWEGTVGDSRLFLPHPGSPRWSPSGRSSDLRERKKEDGYCEQGEAHVQNQVQQGTI